ncbi:hypothetical protein NQZ79_g7350 [Umbelopsis isabellina]|nr:hypothetical protein NQZ79_g7350 [Umbelopsis isabellina]
MPSVSTNLPVELGLRISQYLSAHDIQSASSSSKLLYQLFANEDIWRNAYKSLLEGYPDNKFVVTELVRKTKRPDYLIFDQPLTVNWLDEWYTSWKQRTIFILHIVKIQSEVVSAIRQRTEIFEQPTDAPLFEANFIADMESYLQADFPIDFVIFLQKFAHQITSETFDNEDTDEEDTGDEDTDDDLINGENFEEIESPLLASGIAFKNQKRWRHYIRIADFTNHEVMRLCNAHRHQSPNRVTEEEWEGINQKAHYKHLYREGGHFSQTRDTALFDSTPVYLDRMVLACFSVTYDQLNALQTNWSLILGTDSDLENKIPAKLDTESYEVDLKSMKDGIGKVVVNQFSVLGGFFYELRSIAESFTDYFVQWGSVVIVLGYLPTYFKNGYADLTHCLPKHAHCLPSILLPQNIDWSVGNYAPIYFSIDRTMESYKAHPISEYGRSLADCWDPTWPELPDNIMNGCQVRYWIPYYMPLSSQKPMLLDLSELRREYIPEYPYMMVKCQMNVDFYRTEQKLIDEWADQSPYKSDESISWNLEEVDKVRQQTLHILHLFDSLKERLPVCLFYQSSPDAHQWLYYYKRFSEHLQALELNEYKYDLQQLSVFQAQVKEALNAMRNSFIFTYHGVNLDAISELGIEWSHIM